MKIYSLVIDTDRNAQWFARDMCYYITGRVGKGEEKHSVLQVPQLSDLHKVWFNRDLVFLPCRDGISRPYSVVETPGWFHNGIGMVYKNGQELLATHDYNANITNYAAKLMIDETEWRKQHAYMAHAPKWPAYLSMAIHLQSTPAYSLNDAIINSAKIFLNRQRIASMTGIRLIMSHINRKIINE